MESFKLFIIFVSFFSMQQSVIGAEKAKKVESPLKLVGEKFFRDARFSQFYFEHFQGTTNEPLPQGDQVVDGLVTLSGLVEHPYRGQAMSCAACHLVGQVRETVGAGPRVYTDFAPRSPTPSRNGSHGFTLRNSPNMVGSALQPNWLLHWDGEFAAAEDLVIEGFLGRNMGWLPEERQKAIAHFANVIRNDDGNYPTDTELGSLSYSQLLRGDQGIAKEFLLNDAYRVDISKMSDQEILNSVARLIAGYLRELDYARGEKGHYNGSPWDRFAAINRLPTGPDKGERIASFAWRILKATNSRQVLKFVDNNDGSFSEHQQDFRFSPVELQGLRVFVGQGQCVRCHTPPDFSDHIFHNTGISQTDYEEVHGNGAFAARLSRLTQRNPFIPVGQFPSLDNESFVDLGAWHVLGNPKFPKPQELLGQAICRGRNLNCRLQTQEKLIEYALGAIKTPTLRDLGHSEPYGHSGRLAKLYDVIRYYRTTSERARNDEIVNADPLLKYIRVEESDIEPLVQFMRSLNEDYD